jgi:hypothetical protein
VKLTLNLLQFFQWNPTKSANEEVKGKFNSNKTPLAPLGTKGLVYDDPATVPVRPHTALMLITLAQH